MISRGTVERGGYDAADLADLQVVQQAIIDDLRCRGVAIESCPTSNARIVAEGGLRHPLPGLLATGLPILIGSDDPGLLGTDLPREQMRVRQMGWS